MKIEKKPITQTITEAVMQKKTITKEIEVYEVMVALIGKNWEDEILFRMFQVHCTKDQYEEEEHIQAIKDEAGEDEYSKYVVFDETDAMEWPFFEKCDLPVTQLNIIQL